MVLIKSFISCETDLLMRLIDRLQEYLIYSRITAYSFEHTCELSNGYFGKQLKGKGAVGSEILERIKQNYVDLSIVWLVTGKGKMLLSLHGPSDHTPVCECKEEENIYLDSKDDVIKILNKQVAKLETTVSDKDKIIALLEKQVMQLNYRLSNVEQEV